MDSISSPSPDGRRGQARLCAARKRSRSGLLTDRKIEPALQYWPSSGLPCRCVLDATQAGGAPRTLAAVGPRHRLGEAGVAFLLLAPSLALFAVFTFWPLVRTFVLSFYGNDIIGRSTLFVGTRQYQQLLSSPTLRETLAATGLFALMTVVPSLLLGLGLALLLQARIAAIGAFRTLLATPFAFSVATASVIFAIFYNPGVGVFNGFLQLLHLPPVGWLTSPSTALL